MSKSIKLSLFAMAMLLFSASPLLAQNYNSGIGLRGGVSQGITYKTFVNDKAAFEGILHTRWQGVMLTGLYEIHKDIPNAKGLMWFYGFGAHLGVWDDRMDRRPPWANANQSYTIIGADLIIGLDYLIPNSPVNLSLDYKPAFNLIGYSGIWADGVALSLRFTW
jgi:hypothetical protein